MLRTMSNIVAAALDALTGDYEGFRPPGNGARVRDVARRQSYWWAQASVENRGAAAGLLRRSTPRLLGDTIRALEHTAATKRRETLGESLPPSVAVLHDLLQLVLRAIKQHKSD